MEKFYFQQNTSKTHNVQMNINIVSSFQASEESYKCHDFLLLLLTNEFYSVRNTLSKKTKVLDVTSQKRRENNKNFTKLINICDPE